MDCKIIYCNNLFVQIGKCFSQKKKNKRDVALVVCFGNSQSICGSISAFYASVSKKGSIPAI